MTHSVAVAENSKTLVRKTLQEVLVGREGPEVSFGMCVSALGHQETRSQPHSSYPSSSPYPRPTAPSTPSSHPSTGHISLSEEGACARLEAFLNDGVYRYEKESDRADAPNTSCLPPYLHFGQLSPRWLLWDAKEADCRPPKFQRKLAWRDLAYWQLTSPGNPSDLHTSIALPALARRLLLVTDVVFCQTYPERIVTDLEERRSRSLQDLALVRKEYGRDFTANVMYEGVQREKRLERDHRRINGLPQPPAPQGRARRTLTSNDRLSIVPGASGEPEIKTEGLQV
ncbi:hypothetical protein FQN60_014110, partial [Etheostoma spectabile]